MKPYKTDDEPWVEPYPPRTIQEDREIYIRVIVSVAEWIWKGRPKK